MDALYISGLRRVKQRASLNSFDSIQASNKLSKEEIEDPKVIS
jgi:hypothetical protein